MALNTKFNAFVYVCVCVLIACTVNYIILQQYRSGYSYYQTTNISKTITKVINTVNVSERSMPLFKEREKTKTKICKSCSRNVPKYIIQYGIPRTATTFQFQILCVCMAMLHEDEINSIGCYQHRMNTSLRYNIIKVHEIRPFLTRIPSNSWIFMTSSDALSARNKKAMTVTRQIIYDKKFTVPYIADVANVSRYGHSIVYEYQTFFGLSDEKMEYVVEYFRYWDILRLCCGMQMSSDWRNRLSPVEGYKQHHDPHSRTYPACEMYNIREVEQLLINTYVFKKFAHIDALRFGIGRVSDLDGTLNGRYCERCNKNISKRHLKINYWCA